MGDLAASQAIRNLHAQTPSLVDKAGLLIPENLSRWGDLFRLLDTVRGAGVTVDPIGRVFRRIMTPMSRSTTFVLSSPLESETPLAVFAALVWAEAPRERAVIYDHFHGFLWGLGGLEAFGNPSTAEEFEPCVSRIAHFFSGIRFLEELFRMETPQVRKECIRWRHGIDPKKFARLMLLVSPWQYSPSVPRVITPETLLKVLAWRTLSASDQGRDLPFPYPLIEPRYWSRPELPVRIIVPPLKGGRIDLDFADYPLLGWAHHPDSIVIGSSTTGEVYKLFYDGWSTALLRELFWAQTIKRMGLPAPEIEYLSGDFHVSASTPAERLRKRSPSVGYRMKNTYFPKDGWQICLYKEREKRPLPDDASIRPEVAEKIRENVLTLLATLEESGVWQNDGLQIAVNLWTGEVAFIDYGAFEIFDVYVFEEGLQHGFPKKGAGDYSLDSEYAWDVGRFLADVKNCTMVH